VELDRPDDEDCENTSRSKRLATVKNTVVFGRNSSGFSSGSVMAGPEAYVGRS
jgi:hypothetical protein